jgi:uncharacterized protein
LFALLRPSPAVQAPKLRAAIRSLKLARVLGDEHALVTGGLIIKTNNLKQPFEQLCEQHATTIHDPHLMFDITKLCQQIENECVWPTARGVGGAARWGLTLENDLGHCVYLQSRIDEMLDSDGLSCIFKPEGKQSLFDVIQAFLNDDSRILRVSLRFLTDSNNCREVVANAIGRYLLDLGRSGTFTKKPLIVFLDEAHRFLNRWLGDDNSKYVLDASI